MNAEEKHSIKNLQTVAFLNFERGGMNFDFGSVMHQQLLERRDRVAKAISSGGADAQLAALLHEVDAALERFDSGSYGLCEVCGDTVEADRLIANPLEHFCLDHLNAEERRALEDDISLASRIQLKLLPDHGLRFDGWHFDYCYEPARLVSGDYVDIIQTKDTGIYFALGDISGKGIAASMLMVNLHAVFRSLISLGLGVDQLVERAGRLFAESTLPGHYATLIFGQLTQGGEILICNAGHPPGLLIRDGRIEPIAATGLPLGMFPEQKFSIDRLNLKNGDALLLYTDGVLDAQNHAGEEYGMPRLINIAAVSRSMPPDKLVASCLADVSTFRESTAAFDDITMMGVRRAA